MDKDKLMRIKEAAQKASQGNWFVTCNAKGQLFLNSVEHDRFESTIAVLPDNHYGDKNADYLAAVNPSVILALIEDCENRREALHGMFLLVDQLKACLNLKAGASLEETIKTATDKISELNGRLSGAMNANGEAQEIIAELKRKKAKLEKELDGLCHDDTEKELKIERLEKEADWLAMELEKREKGCKWCDAYHNGCIPSFVPCGYRGPDNWREAARKAVEEQCKTNN